MVCTYTNAWMCANTHPHTYSSMTKKEKKKKNKDDDSAKCKVFINNTMQLCLHPPAKTNTHTPKT